MVGRRTLPRGHGGAGLAGRPRPRAADELGPERRAGGLGDEGAERAAAGGGGAAGEREGRRRGTHQRRRKHVRQALSLMLLQPSTSTTGIAPVVKRSRKRVPRA